MGEDGEQKQGLGKQMVEQAKQTAINTGKNAVKKGVKKALGAIGKAIGHAIRAGLQAIVHFLAVTAPYWAPVLGIFLLCVLAVFLILDLFNSGNNQSQNGFTNVTGSSYSIWGCNLTRQEFIDACQNYTGSLYNDLATESGEGTIYDVCAEHNINPCWIFGSAMIESANGDQTSGAYNYWGYACYNGSSSGRDFSSLSDAVEEACQWLLRRADSSTSQYQTALSTAQTYAQYNSNLAGDPRDNLYALYCNYAYLGDKHLCDNWGSSYDEYSEIINYCRRNGSDWGDGGRIHCYVMYEKGWISTDMYATKCGDNHPYASTDITTQEKADYAQYTVDKRVNAAENVFGEGCLGTTSSVIGEEGTVYYQQDYSDVSYGSGTISSCGCGPTSFAMVASDYTGTTITPKDAVDWCGNDYYAYGVGTSWSYFSAAANHFDLPGFVMEVTRIDTAVSELKEGNLVISSQAPGLFTDTNHFILLSSIDSNDRIRVRDPNKRNAIDKEYKDRLFTKEEIDENAKRYWVFKRN